MCAFTCATLGPSATVPESAGAPNFPTIPGVSGAPKAPAARACPDEPIAVSASVGTDMSDADTHYHG